ncbi:hypothetical protein PSACC_01243 [Paramicrosporidium saccamoebae]|uniref:Uncharacterized protein n=1 Tax=Paramicrosporidium saccamoebae TaxID=1246581 RepID=A0A2H9TMH8_9FUNG|nr:hypothetical protein PSACC_01243 [Paramicrosporidium saccamoebae]
MRAIDKDEDQFDMADGLEGLSILDESFLDKVELAGIKTQKWSHEALALDIEPPKQTPDDAELWQALMIEQKTRYEAQISNLKNDLKSLKMTVKTTESGKDRFEREKWDRFNQILDTYFAEYNVQI